uniref:Ycf20 n=1 Tax=Rhipiliopsis peltata TaxID=2320810 RepID=A0A386B1D5_9CHLO|nr:hypothetical protein Ycf20 [Rhipiliopsis peltata]AYC65509.1 hypothetical protein Ycf20 [Rhipiliopsis peltata]
MYYCTFNFIHSRYAAAFKNFLESICTFYISFLIGNSFGTFLIFMRKKIIWDGAILILLILFFELLNSIIYKKKNWNKKLLIIFKNIQIGILLGFFIDAFKVGS